MKFNKITVTKLLSTISLATLLVGCGGSSTPDQENSKNSGSETITNPIENSTPQNLSKKSLQLNKTINGYQSSATLSSNFTTKQNQNLADVMFMYLLDSNQAYAKNIAYTTYSTLNIGSLNQSDFEKQFILDFASYSTAQTNTNIVAQIVDALKTQKITIPKQAPLRQAAPQNASLISSELLSGKQYFVFTEERNIILTINDAISTANAKAGFFNVDIALELQERSLWLCRR
jgi:hypothetical protein